MDASKYHILLVDDEPDIREFLGYNIKKEGYRITTAKNGLEAIRKVKKTVPDLILMDIMMPGMDGIEAVKQIKGLPGTEKVIIVFLTARSDELTQIEGFEAGADDYVSKPLKPKVLMHRIKALLRRLKKDPDEEKQVIKRGSLEIDPVKYEVKCKGKEVFLPKKEFNLLYMMAAHPEKVFSREDILLKVWGKGVVVGDRTIDVHIRKIREKMSSNLIQTIKGVGYKFVEPV